MEVRTPQTQIRSVKIRSMFVAPKDHYLVQFDFSQAESWIVAFLANEQNMKDALMYGDIHSQFGGVLFHDDGCPHKWKKKTCTVCNITITLSQGRSYSEKWHSFYKVKGWWTEIEEKLNRDRSLVTTYGRRRVFFAAWGDELFREATAFE